MRATFVPSVVFVTLIQSSEAVSAGFAKAVFTTNAVCIRNRCVNPIFPGLEDLHRLQQTRWFCSSRRQLAPYMGFCRKVINYDPAIPGGTNGESPALMVRHQDRAASTMFFYHLTGLGLEPWDFQDPAASGDDCIRAIWRMVCFTYFPRSQVGCQNGAETQYLRPCQSSCANYVRTCQVECCDESVSCVFEHTKKISGNLTLSTQGYAPHDGPSSLCTGAAKRSGALGPGLLATLLVNIFRGSMSLEFPNLLGLRRTALWGALAAVALSLQGCSDVPSHAVGNWRGERDYLIEYEFIPPGAPASQSVINSCLLDRISPMLQCSGRGVCKIWDESSLTSPATFCDCDRDWTDPECRTRRKSQAVAFTLSLFFGFLGFDQFYLGFPAKGVLKLITLGGCGVWWLIDCIRVGSAPVFSDKFRVAEDLPRWVYVFTMVSLAVVIGFGYAYYTVIRFKINRRKHALLWREEEEALTGGALPRSYDAAYSTGKPATLKPGGFGGPSFPH